MKPEEGTIGLQSVCASVCPPVCPSVCLSVTFVFRTFLRYAFTYLDESWQAFIWRVTDQVRLSSQLTYFLMSYCPLFQICFPDFSALCFHISEWKLVGSFHMKSYRSSSTSPWLTYFFISCCPLFYIGFRAFLGYDFTFLNESWYQAILTVIYLKIHRNNACWLEFGGVGGGPVLL